MSRPENFDPKKRYRVELTVQQVCIMHILLRRTRGCPETSMYKWAKRLIEKYENALLAEDILRIENGVYLYKGKDGTYKDVSPYVEGEVEFTPLSPEFAYLLED